MVKCIQLQPLKSLYSHSQFLTSTWQIYCLRLRLVYLRLVRFRRHEQKRTDLRNILCCEYSLSPHHVRKTCIFAKAYLPKSQFTAGIQQGVDLSAASFHHLSLQTLHKTLNSRKVGIVLIFSFIYLIFCWCKIATFLMTMISCRSGIRYQTRNIYIFAFNV